MVVSALFYSNKHFKNSRSGSACFFLKSIYLANGTRQAFKNMIYVVKYLVLQFDHCIPESLYCSLIFKMEPKSIQRLYETANEHYHQQWPVTCYTSLRMFDFLLTLSGKSWKIFLSNPSFDKDEMLSKINTLTPDQLEPSWNSGNGLCTSFAIFIATKTDGHFVYGDQGNHRAAFNKEGIIIDSSARKALLVKTR
jgi:hypothetical protein